VVKQIEELAPELEGELLVRWNRIDVFDQIRIQQIRTTPGAFAVFSSFLLTFLRKGLG
jgi:hypothetical protein